MNINVYRGIDYNDKRQGSQLNFNKTLSKCEQSYKKVPWSFSRDGLLRTGDSVMIMNKKTKGFLVTDIGDRASGLDETYMVTTSANNPGPITRSVFVIKKVEQMDIFGSDEVVRYG